MKNILFIYCSHACVLFESSVWIPRQLKPRISLAAVGGVRVMSVEETALPNPLECEIIANAIMTTNTERGPWGFTASYDLPRKMDEYLLDREGLSLASIFDPKVLETSKASKEAFYVFEAILCARNDGPNYARGKLLKTWRERIGSGVCINRYGHSVEISPAGNVKRWWSEILEVVKANMPEGCGGGGSSDPQSDEGADGGKVHVPPHAKP